MRKCLVMAVSLLAVTPLAAQERDDALIAAAKNQLASRLDDPEDVRFRNVFVSRRAGVPVACGEVAAKSSDAGGRGFVRFVGAGSLGVFLPADVDDFGALWRHFCG